MSFVDVRFPEKWALDAVRSVHWDTEIITTRNQREKRNGAFANPRYSWDLSMSAKTPAERAEFDDWWMALRGPEHTFPFRDPADHELDRQTIGIGDGTTDMFQIIRTFSVGSLSHDRAITMPVTETVLVWVNEVAMLTGWSVDRATGLIEFDTPPAESAVIEAACEFDVRVRFNQAALDWQIADKNNVRGYIWICPGLKLIEVVGETDVEESGPV